MTQTPIKFRYRAQFDLMPNWVSQTLREWLDEGWTCDITVRRVKGCYGPKTVRVEIEASTSDDLAAKRKAFNAMIEAKGYEPIANKK